MVAKIRFLFFLFLSILRTTRRAASGVLSCQDRVGDTRGPLEGGIHLIKQGVRTEPNRGITGRISEFIPLPLFLAGRSISCLFRGPNVLGLTGLSYLTLHTVRFAVGTDGSAGKCSIPNPTSSRFSIRCMGTSGEKTTAFAEMAKAVG